jgi:hypothetical protein
VAFTQLRAINPLIPPLRAGQLFVNMVLAQVLGVFSQHPPLLSKLSKCLTYFLIRGAKRLFSALGSTLTAFFRPQTHTHDSRSKGADGLLKRKFE